MTVTDGSEDGAPDSIPLESLDRELHDIVVPQLFALTAGLETLRRHPEAAGSGTLVVDLALTAERALADLRALSRGERLDWGGPLSDVCRRLGDTLRRTERISGARVGLRCDLSPIGKSVHVDGALEYDIRAVVGESVTNALRHGHASTVDVRVVCDTSTLMVVVNDDGAWSAAVACGSGVASMRARAERWGGELSIAPHDGGTALTWTVPLPAPRPAGR